MKKETHYNKLLWIGVAISVICIIVGGIGAVHEGPVANIMMMVSICGVFAVWILMGLSVWIYGIFDMHRERKENQEGSK